MEEQYIKYHFIHKTITLISALQNVPISNDPNFGVKRVADWFGMYVQPNINTIEIYWQVYRLDVNGNRVMGGLNSANGPYEITLYASNYYLVDSTGTLQGNTDTITDPAVLATLTGQFDFFNAIAESGTIDLYGVIKATSLACDNTTINGFEFKGAYV